MNDTAPTCRHGCTGPHRYSIPVFEPGDDSQAFCSGPPQDRTISDWELDAPFIPRTTSSPQPDDGEPMNHG